LNKPFEDEVEEDEEENILVTFGFSTFVPPGTLFDMKILKDETVVIKAYKFTV